MSEPHLFGYSGGMALWQLELLMNKVTHKYKPENASCWPTWRSHMIEPILIMHQYLGILSTTCIKTAFTSHYCHISELYAQDSKPWIPTLFKYNKQKYSRWWWRVSDNQSQKKTLEIQSVYKLIRKPPTIQLADHGLKHTTVQYIGIIDASICGFSSLCSDRCCKLYVPHLALLFFTRVTANDWHHWKHCMKTASSATPSSSCLPRATHTYIYIPVPTSVCLSTIVCTLIISIALH